MSSEHVVTIAARPKQGHLAIGRVRAPARPQVATAATALRTPLWLRAVGFLAWLVTFLLVWQAGDLRAYGDALSHELIARRVTDSLAPGLSQLGNLWLPLPSLALVPVVALDPLWRLGIAGALLGAVYLQLAIGALYRAGRLIGGATVGCLAVVVFLANPNTLYLFTVPLTEAPALAFGCLCGAALAEVFDSFSRGEVRPGAILRAALAAAATLLCRYDGWMLALLAGVLIGIAALVWLRSWQKVEAVVLFYAIAPLAASAFWIIYNWTIFGDPLAFLRGPYSSADIVRDLAARGIIPTIGGRPPELGHPLRALVTYGQAVLENTGLVPLLLAAAGTILAFVQVRRRPAGLTLIALAAPLPFYLIALTNGQSVIVTRAAESGGLFNVRYGGALAPAIALAIATLAGVLRTRTWRLAVPLAVVALISGATLFADARGPVTIAEGVIQRQARTMVAGSDAGHWLAAQPGSGLVLLDDALQPQTQALVTYSDRPLRDYVTSSTPEDWTAALRQPPASIDWIVTLGPASRDRPNDRVGRALLANGQIAGFVPAFDDGEIVIFRRATLPTGPVTVPGAAAGVPMIVLATITPPLAAFGKALMGALGVVLILGLVALLLLREAIPVSASARLQRWRFRLTASLAPLVAFLVVVLTAHLLMISAPVLAAEFDPPETTGQAALKPTATAGQQASNPTATGAPPAAVVRPSPTAGTPTTPTATSPAMTPQSTPARTTAPPPSPQRIGSIITGLSTGQFEVTITYTSGTRSNILVRFDLGSGQQPARLYSQTTYQGATGARAVERITIGNQTWTREQGQSWVEAPTPQGVREEVESFLPGTEALAAQGQPDGPNALRWYDATRDADLRLATDPLTGVPQQFQQTTRGTGTVLNVTYWGWNTPVEIAPPAGQ